MATTSPVAHRDPVHYLLALGDTLAGCFLRFRSARGTDIPTRRAELTAIQDAVMRVADYRDRDVLVAECVRHLTGKSLCPFTPDDAKRHADTMVSVLAGLSNYRPAVHLSEVIDRTRSPEGKKGREDRYNLESALLGQWDQSRRQLLLRLAASGEATACLLDVDYTTTHHVAPVYAPCMADVPTTPLAVTTPPADRGKSEPRPVKGKNIQARMLKLWQERQHEVVNWSSDDWAAHLGCGESTVRETKLWRTEMKTFRVAERLRRAEHKERHRTKRRRKG